MDFETLALSKQYTDQKIKEIGSGGKQEPLIVNLLEDGTTDKSGYEIANAIESGKPVSALWNNTRILPFAYDNNTVVFNLVFDEDLLVFTVTENTYVMQHTVIPSKSEIPTKPEDIGAQPKGNYATEQFVEDKIAEAQLSGGYATEEYVDSKIEEAQLSGDGYVLTEADKQEIAELTAPLVDVPSGGGDGKWEVIRDITLEEDTVQNVIVTTKDNGESFSYRKVACTVIVGETAIAGGFNKLSINPNPSKPTVIWNGVPVTERYYTPGAKKKYHYSYTVFQDAFVIHENFEWESTAVFRNVKRKGVELTDAKWAEAYEAEIKGVAYNVNGTIPAGTRFIFYGMK